MSTDYTYKAHVTVEQLKEFINDQLLPDNRREWMEAHIQQCELCLQLFMQELDVTEQQPAQPDWTELENNVMMAIHNEAIAASGVQIQQMQSAVRENNAAKRRPRSTWLSHPITHYSLAASITLLLLVTGVLGGLSQQVSNMEEYVQSNRHIEEEPTARTSTWSEEMMSRTSQWLDGIQEFRFK